jgi:hypothetical protein
MKDIKCSTKMFKNKGVKEHFWMQGQHQNTRLEVIRIIQTDTD